MEDPSGARPTWHDGEVAMQRSVGVADALAELGARIIRDHLTDQHRAFFPLLSTIVVGSVDAAGDPWATLQGGEPGFVHVIDERTLRLGVRRDVSDPATAGIVNGAAVAALGIDFATRRRNRVNGFVAAARDDGFELHVVQSFGNCPKYIHLRDTSFQETAAGAVQRAVPAVETTALDDAGTRIVRAADTFFVASYVDLADRTREVDASHRGGRPGFVRIAADGTLEIPDFAGNRFFNTLGNITANAKAGLTFVDFATGDVVQLTGVATIDEAVPSGAPAETERVWRVAPRRVVRRPGASRLRMALRPNGRSPFALATGTWDVAAATRVSG